MNKNKFIKPCILAVCILVFLFNFGKIIYQCYDYMKAQNEYASILVEATEKGNTTPAQLVVQPDEGITEYYTLPDFTVNFESLMRQNKDCIGWLYIPSIDLSYPVVQSHDNEEYLTTTFTGSKSLAGCIFNDCNIVAPFNQKTILYGHNMKDGTMFSKIYHMQDTDDVWLYLPDSTIRHYSVEAVKDTDTSDKEVYSTIGSADTLILSTCIKKLDRHVVILKHDGTFSIE